VAGIDRRAFLAAAGSAAFSVAAGKARAARPADPRLRALATMLQGTLITPGGSGYDSARVAYNERYDAAHPIAIARPVSVGDIQKLVRWAHTHGVRPIVRSGGHSYAGYSTGSGLVVDLRQLDGVSFDRRTGLVTVGAGTRLIDIEVALAQHGRAIPAGSCATVGIGGLAQGGGVGLASRAFGTTSDNVVSLGIVTADGRYRICEKGSNDDLLWACRGGGGGNFGVVTHFTLRTHAVSSASYFFADWSWAAAADVVELWQSFMPHAPERLFSICTLSAGGGTPSVQVFGQYLGSEEALQSALSPLRAVPGLRLTTGSSSYLDAQLRWAGCLGKTPAQCHLAGEAPGGTLARAEFAGKSDYLARPLSAAGRATIIRWIEQAAAHGPTAASLLLDSYGGALNRPAPDATAFVHRDAIGSAQYLVYWGSGGEQAALSWLRGFYGAMRPYVSGFAYQNYIDPDLATWAHAYYGANYPRLQAVKRDVDPNGLFRFRQSIRPA
jgi:FAD/FMN-containing dehydrogenase